MFPQGFSKEQLVRAILMQYIVEYESVGRLDLQDAAFKGILERALKLPESIFRKGNSEGEQIDACDKGLSPLFVLNAALSPDEHIGFYEQYEPEYVAPPVFSTQDPSTVRGTLRVYLVNPYSKNQETAIAFIEYCFPVFH